MTNNFIRIKFLRTNYFQTQPNIWFDQANFCTQTKIFWPEMLFGELKENSSVALLSSTCLIFQITFQVKISQSGYRNLFGQIKYWVGENLGLKKVWSQKLDPDEIDGPNFCWVQTILLPNKVWTQKFDMDEIVGPNFFESKQFYVQKCLGQNKFGSEKMLCPEFFCFLKCFLVKKKYLLKRIKGLCQK